MDLTIKNLPQVEDNEEYIRTTLKAGGLMDVVSVTSDGKKIGSTVTL